MHLPSIHQCKMLHYLVCMDLEELCLLEYRYHPDKERVEAVQGDSQLCWVTES